MTKEKTQELIEKRNQYTETLMEGFKKSGFRNANGQIEVNESEVVYEISKFDDQLYIEEGFRKEDIEKAIEVYGLKQKSEQELEEEERLAYMQMMSGLSSRFAKEGQTSPAAVAAPISTTSSVTRPSGKQLVLE